MADAIPVTGNKGNLKARPKVEQPSNKGAPAGEVPVDAPPINPDFKTVRSVKTKLKNGAVRTDH